MAKVTAKPEYEDNLDDEVVEDLEGSVMPQDDECGDADDEDDEDDDADAEGQLEGWAYENVLPKVCMIHGRDVVNRPMRLLNLIVFVSPCFVVLPLSSPCVY
jgi:hypothetical protein